MIKVLMINNNANLMRVHNLTHSIFSESFAIFVPKIYAWGCARKSTVYLMTTKNRVPARKSYLSFYKKFITIVHLFHVSHILDLTISPHPLNFLWFFNEFSMELCSYDTYGVAFFFIKNVGFFFNPFIILFPFTHVWSSASNHVWLW